MKKTLLIAAAFVALTACNKTLIETQVPESEYGYINLGITADSEMVETKSFTDLTAEESKGYYIAIKSSNDSFIFGSDIDASKKKFSSIPATGVAAAAGSYTVIAESITESEAESGYGQKRLYGTGNVTVEAGKACTAVVDCSVANAEVTVVYEQSFIDNFNTYTTSITDDSTESATISTASGIRTLKLDGTNKSGFYNVDNESLTLKWVLTATNKNGVEKAYFKTFQTVKAQKTTISFVSGTDGSINVTIKANDNYTTQSTLTYKVDPITGVVTETNNQ